MSAAEPEPGSPIVLEPGSALGRGGVATLLFAATFTIMVGCVVAPGLPVIAGHLGMEHHSGWLVTLPSLGVVVFGPAAGWLAARGVTSRLSMLAGLLAYGAFGVAAPVFARWPSLVFVDRLLLGGATAIVMASGTDLIASFYHGPPRLRMIAWQGMATEGGGIVLLAIGGVLGALNWRLPFLLYTLAFVCFFCVLVAIPIPPAHSEQEGVGAAESRSAVGLVLLAATLSMMLFFVAVLNLPGALASRLNYGAASVGYVLSYISLCAVLWVSVLPKALEHIRPGRLQCLAFLLYGAAHLIFAESRNVYELLAGGAIMGCAFACSIPVCSHLIVDLSAQQTRVRNLGYLSTCIFLGQVLSSFASYTASSGQRVMMLTGGAGVVLAILWLIRERAAPQMNSPVAQHDLLS